jgi:nitroreductase
MPLSSDTLLESLNWRYATKKFDTEYQLSAAEREALYNALRLTPSSFGLQPWKFVVVENPAVRQELQAASYKQSQISEASLLLVLCRNDHFGKEDVARYVESVAKARRQPLDGLVAYRQMMDGFVDSMSEEARSVWMEKQVYIALGNLLTSCALLGLDACPIEGFSRSEYDRILNLPAHNARAMVVCAVGKRAADDAYIQAAKVRYTTSELIVTIS